jgi:alkylation response protein AidB-like acyl-CoA dehydrogenase
MSTAITDDHRALADTASDLLRKRDARGAARALLEGATEELPAFWRDVADLGWLGLHLPEEHGGSGYGIPELVVVVEEMGRAIAPGPFVPTVLASAVIDATADGETKKQLLPGLADGSVTGAVALGGGGVTVDNGAATGDAGVVLGGALADLVLAPAGDDVVVVDARAGEGVAVATPANHDPTRP